jgi:electron transfer flavoprotein alpha subunit
MTVLVVADHDRGVLDPTSLQAVTAARALDPQVDVLVVGAEGAGVAGELAAYGASTVHVATSAALTDYAPQAAARAAVELVSTLQPSAIIAVGTPRGNEVLAHVAAILDIPFAAECQEVTLGAGAHDIVRNRWGGNVLETSTVHSDVLVASFTAHAIKAEPAARAGTVVEFEPALTPADTVVRVLDRVGEAAAGVGLAEARVIVSGGRGVGGPEGFAPIDELAELLGGAVGCSRVVTSNGWRPHNEQVGQTGTKVAPDLYIAAGISGATQHIAGMRTSKTIVAINTDKDAPIMGYAHYAIVGDVSTILPALVAATRAAKE